MNQSVVRTLGVAALGAAFAAAGAGSASAVSVPLDSAAGALPAAVALDSAADTLPAVQKSAGNVLDRQGGSDFSVPPTNLLGGLPAGGVTGALPFGG